MISLSKLLSFTLFRYVDVGIVSLLLIFMAKNVGPYEYGSFAYAFILITYSAYVVLGTNQAIVKLFPLSQSKREKNIFLEYGIFLTLLGIIFLLIIFFISPAGEINYLILMICINKLITELAVTFSRVQGKLVRINLLYFSNSLPLLAMFIFNEMSSMPDYFLIWYYSTGISAIVGILFISQYIYLREVNFNFNKFLIKKEHKEAFRSGVLLAMVGFSTPLIATFDKLVLNAINYDNQFLGFMQLADNISMVISLALATLIFVITPDMIKRINQGLMSSYEFLRNGYIIFFIISIFIVGLILLLYPFFQYFFPNYQLLYPLLIQVLTRLTILSLFMINVVVMVNSLELSQIKEIVKAIAFFMTLLLLSILFLEEKYYFYFIPLCGFMSSITLHINMLKNKHIGKSIS